MLNDKMTGGCTVSVLNFVGKIFVVHWIYWFVGVLNFVDIIFMALIVKIRVALWTIEIIRTGLWRCIASCLHMPWSSGLGWLMVQTVSYSKLLTGLNFVDLLPICFKFHGSNLHHKNHENLYTTKFNTLTVYLDILKQKIETCDDLILSKSFLNILLHWSNHVKPYDAL